MSEENDSDNKVHSSHQTIAAYLAAATAAAIKTTGTHVMDTVSKRLQTNNNVAFSFTNLRASFNNLYSVIYPNDKSSLWRGYSAALMYRVSASTITLGTQPGVQKFLLNEYGHEIAQWTGDRYKSTAAHMLSGALFGGIEATFIPLDKLKIMRQINNTTSLVPLFNQHKRYLYTGFSITCLRNFIGFSTLFGVTDLVNGALPRYADPDVMPLYHRLIASAAGAITMVIVTNPADVVKTAVQAQALPEKGQKTLSARTMAAQIYTQNGLYGFWRGVLPRLGSIAPQMTYLMTLSNALVPVITKALDGIERSPGAG